MHNTGWYHSITADGRSVGAAREYRVAAMRKHFDPKVVRIEWREDHLIDFLKDGIITPKQ